MRKLKAAQCKTITKPGFYRVDDTLYLCVKHSGRKSWVQRIVINKRRTDLGLGPYPLVPLSEARDLAVDNRRLIRRKISPLDEKRRAKIPTFRAATDSFHESRKSSWKSEQTARTWMQPLELYAMPSIGDIPVDRLKQRDVIGVLEPIWNEIPETARRIRSRIRAILEWCQAREYIQQNVADNRIKAAFPDLPKVKDHHRSLDDYRDMPEVTRTIETGIPSLHAKLCLLFVIYTATRSNEARGARWSEIDLDAAIWEIPESRMKAGQPHRVPLSRSALAVLDQAEHLRDGSDLIFPSPAKPGHPMSTEFWVKPMKRVGLWERTTIHGFRTSFRTWAEECADNIPREVKELALAHTVGNAVEQAYIHSDLLEKRTSLMQLWNDFLRGEIGDG